MTNLQLLLTIGIPGFLVLLSWVQTNTRLGRLETAIDKTASELTGLRIDINRDMVSLRDSIHRDMVSLHERVAVVESRQQ